MENRVVNLPLDSLFQPHLLCEKVSTVTNTVASLCVLPLRLERIPELSLFTLKNSPAVPMNTTWHDVETQW